MTGKPLTKQTRTEARTDSGNHSYAQPSVVDNAAGGHQPDIKPTAQESSGADSDNEAREKNYATLIKFATLVFDKSASFNIGEIAACIPGMEDVCKEVLTSKMTGNLPGKRPIKRLPVDEASAQRNKEASGSAVINAVAMAQGL